jgi:hypothetical protein
MERSDEPAKRPFLRRTIVGAGWAFLLWIGLSLVVAGWFWYGFSGGLAGDLWPALQTSLLVVATLNLQAVPVLLVLWLSCGAVWAWVVDGCPRAKARP